MNCPIYQIQVGGWCAMKILTNLKEAVNVKIHPSVLRMRTEMTVKMVGKMIGKMTLHFRTVAKDVALELLEEIVKVEVEVSGTSARVEAGVTATAVVGATFFAVRQYLVSCGIEMFSHKCLNNSKEKGLTTVSDTVEC